jgi:uncharacterized protein YbaA (DUF1428 family)
MAYIDGYVAAVPNTNKQAYLELAAKMAGVFRKHGATRVMETWQDDVPEGKLTSFPMAVKRETGESIIFSWIEWPSKAARNEAWKTVMSDPAMQGASDLFDGKRMIFGGFDVILDV